MRVEDKAVASVVAAAVVFGLGNLAFRIGEGDAIAVAAHRCLVGAVLLAPVCFRVRRRSGVSAVLVDRNTSIAMLITGCTMVVSAVVLRTLTGPQAGLAIAIIPLIVLSVRRFFVQHKPAPLVPLSICITAAAAAAATGGLGELSPFKIALLVLFLAANAAEVISMERARQSTPATVVVVGGLVVGAALALVLSLAMSANLVLSPAAFLAAGLVGLAGTVGRSMRGYAMLYLGSAVTSSTSQIAALITAVGGVVLFHDELEVMGMLLGLLAAFSALVAVLGTRKADLVGQA
jgi:drug/metabolite transporter (DMT)-like permease